MADQNTRVGRERIGRRADDRITARESANAADRVGGYTESDVDGPGEDVSRRYNAAPGWTATPDRTRAIRAEIEQTREDLSETVNAIQDRLHPSTIASNAVESVKDAARGRMRDMAETETGRYVSANPVPTAMIGIGVIGVAWWALGREAGGADTGQWSGRRDWRARPVYEADTDVRMARAQARTTARYMDQAGDGPGLAERGKQTVRRGQNVLRRTWNENPLLIGMAAAVLGGLAAASLPETERENRLMGEARDNVIEGVQQAVKDKVGEVQHAATNAVTEVQKVVGLASEDRVGDTPNG